MKQLICTLFFFLAASLALFAVEPVNKKNAKSTDELYSVEFPAAAITLEDIMQYKPRELGKKYGVKFNFKQRLALSITRSKLKRAERKGKDLNEAFNSAVQFEGWYWPAFLLGLILGLIGWLITVLVWPNEGKGIYAVYGMLAWIALVLVFAVI